MPATSGAAAPRASTTGAAAIGTDRPAVPPPAARPTAQPPAHPTGQPTAQSRAKPPAHPTAADWLLVVGICLFAAFASGMAYFYLPWYIGSVPMPVSILGVGALAWALPRAAYRLTGSLGAAVAPAGVVFAVVVGLLLLPNSLDLRRPPRVAFFDQWRLFVLLGVLALAAAASLSLLWGDRLAQRLRAEEPPAEPPDEPPGGVTPVTTTRSGTAGRTDGGDTGAQERRRRPP